LHLPNVFYKSYKKLFFLYFGLPKLGIRFSSELCGVIGLSFLGGAYMTEAFRSGLSTVQKIQKESAQSLGLSKGQIMRYVIFPQALSVSIPAIVANRRAINSISPFLRSGMMLARSKSMG